jgi:hypothetical protein
LIKIALDAVLAGIDSPALVQPAGLGRKEEPEARELFGLACDELGLAPPFVAGRDQRSVEKSAHFAGRDYCQDGPGAWGWEIR